MLIGMAYWWPQSIVKAHLDDKARKKREAEKAKKNGEE
jgi:hypothetical protein